MSSCIDVGSEKLCYIPCKFCNIILAVSVPCSSLLEIVTVRCGHCGNLWSVNMAAALQSLSWQEIQHPIATKSIPPFPSKAISFYERELACWLSIFVSLASSFLNPSFGSPDFRVDLASSSSCNKAASRSPPQNDHGERTVIVNPPPEKRQRVPSAYNQFIKEEIQRIKASNPEITHREAFSTAAKNWAHFPHIHFGLMLEANNQSKLDQGSRGI